MIEEVIPTTIEIYNRPISLNLIVEYYYHEPEQDDVKWEGEWYEIMSWNIYEHEHCPLPIIRKHLQDMYQDGQIDDLLRKHVDGSI